MSALRPILLVEDNQNDLVLTLSALKRSNLANDIIVTRDGSEALDFLLRRGAYANREENAPIVVFLDLKMPKMDGLDVLQHMKADPSLQTIPVVMLTSSNQEVDLVKSYRLGVNAYVVKPVDAKQFMDSVQQLGLFWGIVNEPPPAR
ncbi:MAG: two-component system response regulator [Verrucomicrobia bacterium Tous-C9LFEB]|nr:MAG: two-component system response regulator [Verrucomicrobia bacterium Tous-C9LFEB]